MHPSEEATIGLMSMHTRSATQNSLQTFDKWKELRQLRLPPRPPPPTPLQPWEFRRFVKTLVFFQGPRRPRLPFSSKARAERRFRRSRQATKGATGAEGGEGLPPFLAGGKGVVLVTGKWRVFLPQYAKQPPVYVCAPLHRPVGSLAGSQSLHLFSGRVSGGHTDRKKATHRDA